MRRKTAVFFLQSRWGDLFGEATGDATSSSKKTSICLIIQEKTYSITDAWCRRRVFDKWWARASSLCQPVSLSFVNRQEIVNIRLRQSPMGRPFERGMSRPVNAGSRCLRRTTEASFSYQAALHRSIIPNMQWYPQAQPVFSGKYLDMYRYDNFIRA